MTMSSRMREEFYDRFRGRCYYCGKPLLPDLGGHEDGRDWLVLPERHMIIEHMWPKSRGGSDDVANLVPSCAPCNTLKGSLMSEEFRLLLGMIAGKWRFFFPNEMPDEFYPERDCIVVVSKEFRRSMLRHNFPLGYWEGDITA